LGEARKFVDDGELRGITFDSTGGYGRRVSRSDGARHIQVTVVKETWRERDWSKASRAHAKYVSSSNVHEYLVSHAYMECGHVAQWFALSKFRDTRHDNSIRDGRAKTFVTMFGRRNDQVDPFDANVRRPMECKMFFRKAA
jgi:hypothetical protein